MITNLAKEKKPGIKIIERTPKSLITSEIATHLVLPVKLYFPHPLSNQFIHITNKTNAVQTWVSFIEGN